MKNFHFDNGTSKNIFSHPYFYYMTSESLQGQEQFHYRNYLLEMFKFHAFKKCTTKTKLFKSKKSISKPCTPDYSWKCLTQPHF